MARKEGKSVGKAGRLSAEDKQRRLTIEEKEGGKRVKFMLSEERLEKEEKRKIAEVCNEVIGIELNKLEEEKKNVKEELRSLKEMIKANEERMGRLEGRLEVIEEWIKEKGKEVHRKERDSSSEGGARGLSSRGSDRDNSSVRSEGGTSIGSNLSAREVERIKKWLTEKDREDRRKNIVLKEIRFPKEIGNDRKKASAWAESVIKEKLCIDTKVIGCRESGAVLMIRLASEEEKREITRNKFR